VSHTVCACMSMRTLSVVSTVFLPLSFLAGVYGA
jgi:Mg2+ and Co2+ transporter CorA